MTDEELREAIYKACLAAASEMGTEELKKMSWFERNAPKMQVVTKGLWLLRDERISAEELLKKENE